MDNILNIDNVHFDTMIGQIYPSGPGITMPLKVKQDLSYVLIFQHAVLNAKFIAWIDLVCVVKDIIVIFRKIKTILI